MIASRSGLESKPLHNDLTSVRGFFILSLPLILLASSHSLAYSLNGLFLAHYSTSVLQAHAIGNALIALFQSACMRMSAEAQIFISQASNSQNESRVGVYLWQMIWLSLLSVFVTLPIGLFISNFYFDNSLVQQEAKEYFRLFLYGNFLFPLSTALNTFYSGRGKQKALLIASGLYVVMHTVLAKLLIGHLGLKGAAMSHIISQSVYCCAFLVLVLRRKYRIRFGTDQWKIKLRPLLASMKVGIFNGMSAALMSLSWTVIVKMVATKGADYLTIVAFGNSCAVFLSFLNLGIGQALSINASGLIGKRNYAGIWVLVRSSTVIISCILCLLIIPLILFPDYLLSIFFPEYPAQFSPEMREMLRLSCRLLWFFELAGGIDRLTRGLLTATGDTVFMFFNYILLLSLGCCLPIYFALNIFNFSPGTFWGVMAFTIFIRNVPLFFRLKQELWKTRKPILT